MSRIFIKLAVHALFTFSSRKKVYERCVCLSEEYRELSNGISNEMGRINVKVPKMKGVDEDMRSWSFFDVLEHNVIVNRSITATVCRLVNGESRSEDEIIDIKKDVMPTGLVDKNISESFLESIAFHRQQVEGLGKLRGTDKSQHPIFGSFDAHKWNCMFAFHLGLHLPQAKYIVKHLTSE